MDEILGMPCGISSELFSFCTGKAEMKTKMCLWAVIQWNENLPQAWPTSQLMVWSFSIIFCEINLSVYCLFTFTFFFYLLMHLSHIYMYIYQPMYLSVSIYLNLFSTYLHIIYHTYLLSTYLYILPIYHLLSINQ